MSKGGKRPGAGRKLGVPNRLTTEVKEVLENAFANIGGEKAFAKWAADNRTEFYKLWGKMLPSKLDANVGLNGNLEIENITAEERKRRAEKEAEELLAAVHKRIKG